MRVVVTGAAGALGAAVVDRFVAEGHQVACFDRMEGECGAGRAWFLVEDLADAGAAAEQIGHAARWLGGMDGLVHLVGAFDWKPVETTTLSDWRALYAANVETAVSVIQAALGHLTEGSAIVTIGAASAQPAGPGMAPYAAAKSGVARLAEALAQELKPRNIRVNSVLPAILDTPRNRADMPDADPSGWTSPDALAEVVHFLALPASRAINGASVETSNGC